ncbi:MAG: SH3 domain-containing protein [Treponemataceae bacterium]|nr:SH3 domain-containing protein [Treponemataceae bacterium]
MKKLTRFCILFLLSILIFTSCSNIMGYSVLLWSMPEYGLSDGDVVPVYIKSNISQTYVIGTNNEEERIEIPLWQITTPVSKGKIDDEAAKYAEYQHIYARVAFDGLPMREAAVNTSKQVYRLRKDEVIKVLYKGEGQAVMSGQNAMEGDWFRVIAKDGTIGWCFSYHLRLFDETEVQDTVGTEEVVEVDTLLESILQKTWYPESYDTMIKQKTIDLNKISSIPAFDFGVNSGRIKLVDDGKVVFTATYSGIEKVSAKNYKLTGTDITIVARSEKFIVAQYPNEKGMIMSVNLVSLDKSVDTIIQEEIERRKDACEAIRNIAESFSSSNYGSLQIKEDNQFVWNGYKLLSPNIIPNNSGSTGVVTFDYFLASSLKHSYDGAIAFTFDKNGKKVIFLYNIEENGIRLEDATKASIKDNLIRARGSSPVVMFFSAE